MLNTHIESTAGQRTIRGMLRVCEAPGCRTITLGGTCVEHDPEELIDREHAFGRPFSRVKLVSTGTVSSAS